MMTLQAIYDAHKRADDYGDRGTIHTYISEYELLFKPLRSGCTLLEIGVEHGNSIYLWDDYFENSNLFYVANSEPRLELGQCNNKVSLINANPTDKSLLKKIGDTTFDIIIDDGTHYISDIIASFELLKDRMNKGGIYIIEDVQQFDVQGDVLATLHPSFQFIDNRSLHGRYDDVLAIYTF